MHKKIELLQKITNLIAAYTDSQKSMLTINRLFCQYLQNNSYDTEIWIKYALVSHCLLKNNYQALECLRTILTYNPGNILVTMLFALISEDIRPMSDELFDQLCNLQTSNREILSLIEYQKAWYYLEKDEALYRYTLENSLDLCGKFVWNLKALGTFHFLHNNVQMGRSLFQKALNNIHYVYSCKDYKQLGIINSDDFLNTRLKGTHIKQATVLMMIDALH